MPKTLPAHPALYWSLALLVLALVSQAPALSPFAGVLLALAFASRLLPQCFWTAALRLFFLGLVIAGCGLLYGWLESDTLRLALLLVLVLKWAESRSSGEFVLLAGASLVAGAMGILQWGEGIGLTLTLALPLLALGVLDAAAHSGQEKSLIPGMTTLRRNLGRMILALPLMAVLFVFFPRIPGPLWDIGITFGLPLSLSLEKSSQGLGVSTRLKPGQMQTQTGVSESAPVLVAEFENWVPPTGLLYWRGPVYYEFDGQEWRLEPEYEAGQGRRIMQKGWTKASVFGDGLARKKQEIHYQIRLTPHDRLWLYSLDLPASLTSESFIGPDWQVLSHRPVREEMRYELSSYLEWEAGGALDATRRQRALALPATGNPRLRALGAELAALPDAEARMKQALAHLAQNGYRVREQFEFQEGADALDHFWFERRTGNADLYAGAFVFLMRAAHIPARLVTGYRGGKLMALTDYVIVKKSHAHAWVEIWDDAKGWRRIDPVDLIAPERFADTAARQIKAAKTPAEKPAAPDVGTTRPRRMAKENAAFGIAAKEKTPGAPQIGWQLPEAGNFLERWFLHWFLHLDGAAQQSLFSQLDGATGDKLGSKFAWLWLLLAAAGGSALALFGRQLLTRLRECHRLPPPQRDWNRLCRLLKQRGFQPQPWECPGDFARRVGAARPLWAEAMTLLANAYTDWRYAPARPDAPEKVKTRARRLYNLILADASPRP
ncbi:hypothetical protein AGMMS49545_01040 [Betaproteobacteria bacterium]|nr:hypothetical protein AGMMS49545_01040 [Betaproteobacteria bacterium]